ncbi:MAG: hypothetical protein NC081_04470 [Roseburia sp.]|nr:hypothetical protein [Roseburia sp.]
MKNYIKPMVLENDELAEGVYMASGDCYTFTANIVQSPATGMDYYTIQIDGTHNAQDGHHSSSRTVVIVFNQNVTYLSSNAAGVSGDGTAALTLTFTDGINGSYHNNAQFDNIGLGQLTVKSESGLAITNVYSTYCNQTCGQEGH